MTSHDFHADPTRPGAIPASSVPPRRQPPPAPPPPGPRRLTRSREDRILAGVSGGLGRYFDVDPILFRLAFAVLVFAGGAGAVAYLAAWLFVPEEGSRTPAAGGSVGQVLLRATLAVVVITVAVLAAFGVFIGAAFGGGPVIAGVVIAAGLAMLVAGLLGVRRARWLALPALVVAIPLAVVAAADVDVDGGIGDREYHPASVTELRDGYDLGMGELIVDLRDVALPQGRTPLDIELGAGSALVLVPADVCVDARARIGVGHADVLGRESDGVDLELEWAGRPADASVPRLALDAEIGAGELKVRRASALFAGDIEPFGGDSCGAVS